VESQASSLGFDNPSRESAVQRYTSPRISERNRLLAEVTGKSLSVWRREPPKRGTALVSFESRFAQSLLDWKLLLQPTAYNRVRVRLES
jgi:hypothetical protein